MRENVHEKIPRKINRKEETFKNKINKVNTSVFI